MGKKVGVIIPSYNQGKYIEAAIRSVIDNRKHADIRIAIMDGGSTDGSVSVIQKYENDIEIWRSEPDGGQANAINKGIGLLMDCDYYMWLNSDDIYEDESAVSRLLEYAEKNNCDVCYGLSHFVDENGKIVGEYPVEEYNIDNLGKRCYLSQPSVMFSKRAYELTGRLNEELHMCLDYEYWIRLAQNFEFGFVREYIGATRVYAGTKTATMQQRHLEEAMQILMQYYGKVPIHWVVTKVLADHPQSVIRYIPVRVLFLLIWPFRNRIIQKSLEGKQDA